MAAELRELVELAEEAREGADPEQFLLSDCEFWRHYFRAQPDRHASMVSHLDPLAAVRAGDEDAAERAMPEHLARSRVLLDALFR
ncbi:MAG TPA: hypothetical protein VLR26_14220 [Frankiaceae bacterium]|nr:hypothetical protein [Frankiaceae bacterium]